MEDDKRKDSNAKPKGHRPCKRARLPDSNSDSDLDLPGYNDDDYHSDSDPDYSPPRSLRGIRPRQRSTLIRNSLKAGKTLSNPPTPASVDDANEPAVFCEKTPVHSFKDLKGIDTIIQQLLTRVVDPFACPKKAALLRLELPKGVLFSGLPGTGKSLLADAIVFEMRKKKVDVKYYQETGSCLNKFVGESERNLRNLFKQAKETAPSVIFFDELDGLGGQRKSGEGPHNLFLNTLLNEINDVKRGQVLLIAATNCKTFCDKALIRKGRFDVAIEIPTPGQLARKQILQHYFGKKDIMFMEDELNEIADKTEGCVGCDLKDLVEQVHLNTVKRVFPQGYTTMSLREIKRKMGEMNTIFETDVMTLLEEIKQTRMKDSVENNNDEK